MGRPLSKSDSAMVALVGYRGEFVADGEEQAQLERLHTQQERQRAQAQGPVADRQQQQKERLAAYWRHIGDRSGSDLSLSGGCIF